MYWSYFLNTNFQQHLTYVFELKYIFYNILQFTLVKMPLKMLFETCRGGQ